MWARNNKVPTFYREVYPLKLVCEAAYTYIHHQLIELLDSIEVGRMSSCEVYLICIHRQMVKRINLQRLILSICIPDFLDISFSLSAVY